MNWTWIIHVKQFFSHRYKVQKVKRFLPIKFDRSDFSCRLDFLVFSATIDAKVNIKSLR